MNVSLKILQFANGASNIIGRTVGCSPKQFMANAT